MPCDMIVPTLTLLHIIEDKHQLFYFMLGDSEKLRNVFRLFLCFEMSIENILFTHEKLELTLSVL